MYFSAKIIVRKCHAAICPCSMTLLTELYPPISPTGLRIRSVRDTSNGGRTHHCSELMFPFEQRGHTCGHRKPPAFLVKKSVFIQIYIPPCAIPQPPFPAKRWSMSPAWARATPIRKSGYRGVDFAVLGFLPKLSHRPPASLSKPTYAPQLKILTTGGLEKV